MSTRQKLRAVYLSLAGKWSKPAPGIHIMNSHFISRTLSTPTIFFNLLEGLQKECHLIRIEEACELIEKRTIAKHPLVAFTFDDGFEECATMIAPVLDEFRINGAFFINPSFIDYGTGDQELFSEQVLLTPGKASMNWDQVRYLREHDHVIGCHTFDHLRCNIDDVTVLEHQIVKCKYYIESKLGSKCDYFAYPFGQLSDFSQAALQLSHKHFRYIFSGHSSNHYFSFGSRVINRRHIEGDWPLGHVRYFISSCKDY